MAPEWRAEFEARLARPLKLRMRYAFVRTYKPVLDDAVSCVGPMSDLRVVRRSLPVWLGYHR